jgi:hypothetical protein
MGGSNAMIEPGNVSVSAPYWISGKTGTLTGLVAGNAVATLVNFGRRPELDNPSAVLINVPVNISQIRCKYIPLTTPAVNGVAFEIHKGTSTVQRTTGGTAYGAQQRKTSGYRAIPTTELSLYVAATGVISGGAFTSVNDAQPFDMMTAGAGTNLSGAESIWMPADFCPLMIEQGEGVEVRATTASSGTGILFICFDFLRQ